MAWLVCTGGPDKGMNIELAKDTYVLGRAKDCDIQLSDEKISRWHARLIKEVGSGLGDTSSRGVFFIEDMGSTNGVKYKGKRIRDKKVKLKMNESFGIGRNIFQVTNKPPDLVAKAARDVLDQLSASGRGRTVDRTYAEAIAVEKTRRASKWNIFSFFKRK